MAETDLRASLSLYDVTADEVVARRAENALLIRRHADRRGLYQK